MATLRQRRRLVATGVAVVLTFIVVIGTVIAQGGFLNLSLSVVDLNNQPITEVSPGQVIEYVIDYSCGNLMGDCGDVQIDFPLDLALVELIQVITTPNYDDEYPATAPPAPPNASTVRITNSAANPIFDGGESAQARVRVRIREDLTGAEDIPAEIFGTLFQDDTITSTDTAASSVPDLEVIAPTEQWSVSKNQVTPAGVAPAPGGQATFQVQMCPDTTVGNISLINAYIEDQFPPGATVIDAGGGTVQDLLPEGAPDGINDTIRWDVLPDPYAPSEGCYSVSYTLEYPTTDFAVGDAIDNVAQAYAANPEVNPDGICLPPCTGNTTNNTIAAPTVQVDNVISKSGPGNAPVAPGDSDGTSVFRIGLDMAAANTTATALTLTDILPVALSDGLPATSVTNITSGTWADNTITAEVEITTTANPAWTSLGTVNGAATSWSSAAGQFIGPGNGGAGNDTTDLVTGIRWRFTQPVPPGFAFDTQPQVRFIVRDGMDDTLPAPNDYDDGTGFRTYTNCVDGEATSLDADGNPQTETGQQCATVRTSSDPVGFANITIDKQSNPDEVSIFDTIQFTLTVNLTEEASGNLIDPVIEDILPPGLNFVSWDSVELIGGDVGGADTAEAPYLIVEDNITVLNGDGDPEIRDRLLFYWDDTDIPAGTPLDCTGACTTIGFTNNMPRTLDLTPPETGVKTVRITFTAEVLISAAASPPSYTNELRIASDSPNQFCQSGDTFDDVDDIDGDGITVGDVLCEIGDNYDVREAADMSSQKWIRSVDGVNGTFDFVPFNRLDSPDNPTCPRFFYDSDTSTPEDERFTRFPCVAEGLPEGNFEYLLRVMNTGVVNTDEYILYDILPYIGDTGVSQGLSGSQRGTEFLAFITGPVEVLEVPANPLPDGTPFTQPTFTIEYSDSTNPCRPEMENVEGDTLPSYPGGCVDDWTETPGDYTTVRAFRIVQNNSDSDGVIPPGTELYFSVPMQINEYGDAADLAETGEIAWNSFAQRFTNAESDRRLLPAEPPQVGIVVEQRFSIGNRVWIDDGFNGAGYTFANANNGVIDPGELPVDNLEVELWADLNDGAGFQLIATDTTRDGGYYIFANLDANRYEVAANGAVTGPIEIDYEVRIPATAFQPGGLLFDYISSSGAQNAADSNNTDSNDTGVDQAVTIATDNYELNGVSSNTFTLTADGEAINETDFITGAPDPAPPLPSDPTTNEGDLGRGENFEDDPDSDLTVDFGFFRPMSIGNIVWLDNDTTVGTPGDGIINGAEEGIPDVVLGLYAADGTTEIDDPSQAGIQHYTVTTDADGYYLFDLLPPGEYVVRVMPENFAFGATAAGDGPLADYINSLPENPADENPSNDTDDSTDHGIDPATDGAQRAAGVFSAVITLTPNSETTADDLGTLGNGRRTNAENSDLTVDFGFWEESTTFSLGNRVWIDINNDGVIDGAEDDIANGINGVLVNLYLDDDGDGIPDGGTLDAPGTPLAQTTTANGGYYLFDDLNPGRYVVQLDPDNWATPTSVLAEYISSTPTDATENAESNDNGINVADGDGGAVNGTTLDDYQTRGIYSNTIQLVPEGEPVGELDPDETLTDPSGNAEDDNSDLTVDFGVYIPMSIGNRVWFDNGATGAGIDRTQYNDGILNGTEEGIGGVTVSLFAGDGVTPIEDPFNLGNNYVVTTDADGYYLFDGLVPGTYVVSIGTDNFDAAGDPLFNLISSFDAGVAPLDDDFDNTDHGADVANPTLAAVVSPEITLSYEEEPAPSTAQDDDEAVTGTGRSGEQDDNSDLTVDFGFVTPPMSLGNRIFFDDGGNGTAPADFDNGTFDGSEIGVAGVVVQLFDAADLSTPIFTTVTDADGHYLFENLQPGDYVVQIPAFEFDATPGNANGPDGIAGNDDDPSLIGYRSSTDVAAPVDGDPDSDDHGVDAADPATTGISSPVITLATNDELTTEDDESAGEIPGSNGETDNNSDLTVDFGFVRPMAIGNRVWFDTDRATGTPGDGIRQTGEDGVVGVALELYLDDGDGVFSAGDTLVAETTTGAGGYYLFDETTTVTGPGADDPNDSPLGPGNYLVHIPSENFTTGPLFGYINSDGTNASGGDNGVDSVADDAAGDENGVNADPTDPTTYPATAGVTSTVIELRYETEPTESGTPDDPDRDTSLANPNGVNVQDFNSDLTVDFGFYQAVSIGNRVWYDRDRNGLNDGADTNPNNANVGIPGVTVQLFYDADGNGVIDGAETTPIATDVTDSEGYYLFDQTGDQSTPNGGTLLPPGNYVVGIPVVNFNAGNALEDHISTVTIVGGQGNDAQIDNDDNGIDQRDLSAPTATPIDIFSEVITVGQYTEPTGEEQSATDGNGRYGIRDDSSDLTVDFGFYEPMSIGNRVWFDGDNDALIDAGELGVEGVLVELYRDGVDPLGTPFRTTVTNADGYYIFDDLPEGTYVVRLAPRNFQDLPDDGDPTNGSEGALYDSAFGGPFSSSESGGATETTYLDDDGVDNNDNGIDEDFPQTNGISSNPITLTYDSEASPTVAPDDLPADIDATDGEGRFGELDRNADMTVDFGVYTPRMSLGNQVFYDYNNNRVFDSVAGGGNETGIPNVIVNLFRDDDNNGLPDSGITNPIETTLTDADGFYIFDDLAPGRYLVQIDEDNFRTVTNGVLQDYFSSQDKDATNTPITLTDDQNDTFENGIDNPFSLATNPDPAANGVFSVSILLAPSSEETTETLGPQGNGEPNIQASNSDLTVDFGFYQPMSIGNRVWFDQNENGIIDLADEIGIAGVTVELYLDDGNGTFEGAGTDTLVPVFTGAGYANFDTTDADGYYLFDNLAPGNYFVHIPASNFTTGNPLFSYTSTLTIVGGQGNDAGVDNDDNGTPDDATVAVAGATSELITLGAGGIPNSSEPVGEADKSDNPPTPASEYDGPESFGRYGETDANSDITVDFGFTLPDESMSIGNRVWIDTDRDGLFNNAEAGVDGVTVLLYRANAAGTPIGAPIARDITANGGYYLFDNLDTDAATATGEGDNAGGPITPGTYVVVIPNSQLNAGGLLEGYTSTLDDQPNPADPDSGALADELEDSNDNGEPNATFGVVSNPITLVLGNERTNEIDAEPGVGDGTYNNRTPADTSDDIAVDPENSNLTVDFGFYQPLSLGNRVWIDANNNGVFDTGELPVPDGVTLTLYQDTDGSGDFGAGDLPVGNPNNPGNPYQVATDNGYYLFENLLPATNYIVVLDQANFLTGSLVGYLGSDNGGAGFADDTDGDLNDNGRDIADPATGGGIPSGLIDLSIGGEPTGEADLSGNPADGPQSRGNNGELDNASNLTVDFGVYASTYYSIGNRVYEDNGNNATAGDGLQSGDEPGVPGVVVNLYLDANNDGTPDSLTPVRTTTTDADGYYLFDELVAGNYIVSIAPQNFGTAGALNGFGVTDQPNGTEGTPNNDTDHTSDHVVIAPDPDFGIYSATYTLGDGTPEPVGETDATNAGAPQDPGTDPFGNPIPDDQSNLTVDFGFIRTMSLGNRVWFDTNQNGVIDIGTEVGIAGVTVQLFEDTNGNGTFDGAGTDTLLSFDTTDGNGYYLFNDLQPGDYFVHIPNDPNWTAGTGPLEGLGSTTPDNNNAADNNDNGVGTGDVNPVPGVTSELVTLAFDAAPTGEADLSNNPADGPQFRGTSNPSDNNSNLTVDFGFFTADVYSIGNRVWFDNGGPTGGGTPNDGIQNGDEEGVAGVIVELYRPGDTPGTTPPIATDTTDADGYYIFDGLPPGDYVVHIASENWTPSSGPLEGFLSTTDGAADTDTQDNGINDPNPGTNGISSGTITLGDGPEPLGEDESPDDGTGANGETDENSNLTVDFGFVDVYDWGDAPDSYGTSSGTNGPNHRIVTGLYLGGTIDDEADGQPVPDGTSNNTGDPVGDGGDEDGMNPAPFVSGTTVEVDVTVVNQTGSPATLVGWFDWNGNGTFEAGEGFTANVPNGTDGVIQLTVDVPDTAEDDTGGNTYARLRLTNDPIGTGDPTGSANSGEVEDYYIEVLDPGLLINKTDGRNSVVAGTFNTYTVTIENSGAARSNVRFLDEIPVTSAADPAGYDPETIEWTCVATNGASCIAGQPAGTGSSGGPFAAGATSAIIDENIDIPRDGRIVYTIRGRVNANAGLTGSPSIVNVAQLPNELPPITDDDETAVIFDPPFGVKTGTFLSDTVIRWTMVWYNPGGTQPNVTISDTVQAPQSLPPTLAQIDLQCTGGGAGGTNTGTCSINGNTIEWNGTMDTSTPANDTAAVRISFTVIVPGPGSYNNTATLDSPTLASVTASAAVSNDPDAPPSDDDNDGDPTILDPAIVKFGSPEFALPGETVTWTIIVSNPNQGLSLDNVSMTDNVPPQMTLDSASATRGTVTTNGQTVSWSVPTMAPNESITITVVTTVRDDITLDVPIITNTAILMTLDSSAANVFTVSELPNTGEAPWWRTWLVVLLMGGAGTALSIGGIRWYQRRRDMP